MLESFAKRYRTELLDRVIPFWLRHSLDREHGGYFTCLTREGNVYDPRKYGWLQGRAVWTLSRLYNELEPRSEWLEAARLIFDFLRLHGRDKRGRYYFSLSREGKPSFFQRKPYAAVFAMLGMLEYAKATNDNALKREAIDLFWQILEWIRHPDLLGRPTLDGAPKMTSLADIMVTVSMATEIARVDQDARYRQVLADCLESAKAFYDSSHHLFFEYSGDGDLRRFPEGRLICPGDSLKASWFLLHALEFAPDDGMRALLLNSIEGALEFGWDREYGGLYYFIDSQGLPLLQLEANMKLWWPHTEAIYALILAYSLTSDKKWLTWLERVDEYTFRVFSDPECGEWFGYADRRGNLTTRLKGNNYKGCFHVPRMLFMSVQRMAHLTGAKTERAPST